MVRGIEATGAADLRPRSGGATSPRFRGIINPLLDRRMDRDDKMAAFLRDLDAKSVDAAQPAPK